jgi:hypothetical protein
VRLHAGKGLCRRGPVLVRGEGRERENRLGHSLCEGEARRLARASSTTHPHTLFTRVRGRGVPRSPRVGGSRKLGSLEGSDHARRSTLWEARRIVRGQSTPGDKNIRTGEAAPVRSGDRQPERQAPVVPQRRCSWLVVDLPLHRSLPPTRGATACPRIVAHITRPGPRSRCERILVSLFTQPRRRRIPRTSP